MLGSSGGASLGHHLLLGLTSPASFHPFLALRVKEGYCYTMCGCVSVCARASGGCHDEETRVGKEGGREALAFAK